MGDDEIDEETVTRRRELMRQRAIAKAQMGMKQEELLAKEEEKEGSEDEEESSEEETDSEEEEQEARLKPVFVRAKDRLTIQEREREELKARQAEREAQRMAEERRRQSVRMVEMEVRKANIAERKADGDTIGMDDIHTDDENDEVEYEAWKVRELRRLKRDREEREAFMGEQAEMDRFRNLTEEEKRAEMKINPKQITNRAAKGTSLCKSIITEEHFTWMKRKMFSREMSVTRHWKINLTRLCFPKLCKSKTLVDLAGQNILIWLIRIQQNMMRLGRKIQQQIKSSIKEWQVAQRTYLRNQQERKIETAVKEFEFMLIVF